MHLTEMDAYRLSLQDCMIVEPNEINLYFGSIHIYIFKAKKF